MLTICLLHVNERQCAQRLLYKVGLKQKLKRLLTGWIHRKCKNGIKKDGNKHSWQLCVESRRDRALGWAAGEPVGSDAPPACSWLLRPGLPGAAAKAEAPYRHQRFVGLAREEGAAAGADVEAAALANVAALCKGQRKQGG